MKANNINELGFLIKNVSIYRDILKDPVIEKLSVLICKEYKNEYQAIEIYSEMFNLLCNSDFKGNLADYIYDKVLFSENLFTLECAKGNFDELNDILRNSVKNDLKTFYKLATIDNELLKKHIILDNMSYFIEHMPIFSVKSNLFADVDDWSCEKFANYCKNNGYGSYSRYTFFYFDGDNICLKPVVNPDNITLLDLKGFTAQREIILENTNALVNGFKANNMLFYGDRGTGKSSTIKALVNEFKPKGLRLIEVSKENLKHLGKIIDALAKIPMKFIVFVDDLTFSDGDDSYTALKAILEGSSNKLGNNMALFATTNRRHLVTETFMAREGDEVHLKDTLDESASLSDRFGITVTFSVPSRIEFLEIVNQLAKDLDLSIEKEELERGANVWASRKTSFSPRTARQYIDYVIAKNN